MFCPNCGKSLSNEAVFCPNCGMRMGVSRYDIELSSKEGGYENPPTGDCGDMGRDDLDAADFGRSLDMGSEVTGHPDEGDRLTASVPATDDEPDGAMDADEHTATSDGRQDATAGTKGVKAATNSKEPSRFTGFLKLVASLAVATLLGRLIGTSFAEMTLRSTYGNDVSRTSRTGGLTLPTEVSSTSTDTSSTQSDVTSDPVSAQTPVTREGDVVVDSKAGRYTVDVTIPSWWVETSDKLLSSGEINVTDAESAEIHSWGDPLQGGDVIFILTRMVLPFRRSADELRHELDKKDLVASYLDSLDDLETISETVIEFSGYPGKRIEYRGKLEGTMVRGQLLIAFMPTTVTFMMGVMPESKYGESGPTLSGILDSAHVVEW